MGDPGWCGYLPGKMPLSPHMLLHYSIISRSQIKVGHQAGPAEKGQSELRRSCFHCLL